MNEQNLWREKVAIKWAELISPLYAGASLMELRAALLELVNLFIEVLLAEPFRPESAALIGTKLVALAFHRAETLQISFQIFEQDILSNLPNTNRLLLYPRFISVLVNIFTAFHEASQKALLEQQEAIRLVMLNDAQQYKRLLGLIDYPHRESSIALTDKQTEVLQLIGAGHNNLEIAEILNIAKGTLSHHTNVIYQVLGVKGRKQAVKKAKELGLI